MTTFSELSNNAILEEGLKEKIFAGQISIRSNSQSNTHELTLLTIETLEYLKRAYNENREEEYIDYVVNDRFNESVQNLIYNSPPLINPDFINLPIEEIPQKIISQYSELMNITNLGSCYKIDLRKVLKKHYSNQDTYNFYNTSIENPYSLDLRHLSTSFDRTQRASTGIPINVIYNSIDAARNLAEDQEHFITMSKLMEEELIIPKKDLDYESFMNLYDLFFLDLYLETFRKELLDTIEIYKNIEFVEKGTEGSYTFEELSDYSLELGTLQEYVAILYYEYRFKVATSENSVYADCSIKNTPLSELSFLLKKDSRGLIDYNELIERVVSDLTQKNVLLSNQTQRDIDSFEYKLRQLDKEHYNLYCERLYEFIGIDDPLTFKYHTNSLTHRLYDLLISVYNHQEENKKQNLDLGNQFGYLDFSEDIVRELTNMTIALDEEISETLQEREEQDE